MIEDEPSPATVVRKGEDLACTSTLAPSLPTTKIRRRHKSYDRSSLRRSARIANCGVLKNLGIVGNDGKFNEDAIQDYADCLKELLPPDVHKLLMCLKGRAFWDFVVELHIVVRWSSLWLFLLLASCFW